MVAQCKGPLQSRPVHRLEEIAKADRASRRAGPALGIEETVDSLRNIYEYNVEQLEVERRKMSLPTTSLYKSGPGEIVGVVERPPMVIGE